MPEEIVGTANAYFSYKGGSKILVIPMKVRQKIGDSNLKFFVVKLDDRGRIIYEPIK